MALFGLLSQPLYILHTTFKKLHVNFSLPKHKNNPLIRTKKKKCLTCMREHIKQHRQKKVSVALRVSDCTKSKAVTETQLV